MTNKNSESDAPLSEIQTIFESACEYEQHDVCIEEIATVDDAETGEQFLEVVMSIPTSVSSEGYDPHVAYARPIMVAYSHLVNKYNFDFDVEVVASVRIRPEELLPFGSVRIASRWATQHVAGDLTLEQFIGLVLDTLQRPENPQDAVGWFPEHEITWRASDPMPAEDFDAQTTFEYWSSGKVPYPGGDNAVDPSDPTPPAGGGDT